MANLVSLWGKITLPPGRRVHNRRGAVTAYPQRRLSKIPFLRRGFRFWHGKALHGDIHASRFFLEDLTEGKEYLVIVETDTWGAGGKRRTVNQFYWTADSFLDRKDIFIPSLEAPKAEVCLNGISWPA